MDIISDKEIKIKICEGAVNFYIKPQKNKWKINYYFFFIFKFCLMTNVDPSSKQRQRTLLEFSFGGIQISESEKKQRRIVQQQDEEECGISCQPFLIRHSECSNACLDFKIGFQGKELPEAFKAQITKKPLSDCFYFLKSIIDRRKQLKQKNTKNKPIKKQKKIKKRQPLTQKQRDIIFILKKQGIQNKFIAAILGVTLGQVSSNEKILLTQKMRVLINLEQIHFDWILEQAQQSSNSILFNAQTFLNAFKEKFPNNLSIFQFRQLLKFLKIRFRIPNIKPLSYFKKIGKNDEAYNFIESMCGYKDADYQFIFVDECYFGTISRNCHRQWHSIGSAKQSLQRVSSNKCLIAAIGERNFMCYQIINGSGKAILYKHFIENLINYAVEFYQDRKFVIIMDNCTIHKANLMQEVLDNQNIQFTPAYRPEFNAIEHLFGWLKREIIKTQPMLSCKFIFQVHQVLNQVTEELISEWCSSIYKPMLSEIKYLQR